MNTELFHSEKEKQVKLINKAIHTVLLNPFHDFTKQSFLDAGAGAINKINLQREGVYALTEDFKDFKEEYNPEDKRFNVEVPTSDKVETLHMSVLQLLSDAKTLSTGFDPSKITHLQTMKKLPAEHVDGYIALDKVIVNDMDNMIHIIHSDAELREEPKEEEEVSAYPETILHTLIQEDFDRDPDLSKTGLKVGDEIEIDAEGIIEAQKEEDVPVNTPGTPSSPPAVTPIEEIQAQNATEKITPRKD